MDFPDELILKCLTYIEPSDYKKLKLVNRRIYNICQDKRMAKWRDQCEINKLIECNLDSLSGTLPVSTAIVCFQQHKKYLTKTSLPLDAKKLIHVETVVIYNYTNEYPIKVAELMSYFPKARTLKLKNFDDQLRWDQIYDAQDAWCSTEEPLEVCLGSITTIQLYTYTIATHQIGLSVEYLLQSAKNLKTLLIGHIDIFKHFSEAFFEKTLTVRFLVLQVSFIPLFFETLKRPNLKLGYNKVCFFSSRKDSDSQENLQLIRDHVVQIEDLVLNFYWKKGLKLDQILTVFPNIKTISIRQLAVTQLEPLQDRMLYWSSTGQNFDQQLQHLTQLDISSANGRLHPIKLDNIYENLLVLVDAAPNLRQLKVSNVHLRNMIASKSPLLHKVPEIVVPHLSLCYANETFCVCQITFSRLIVDCFDINFITVERVGYRNCLHHLFDHVHSIERLRLKRVAQMNVGDLQYLVKIANQNKLRVLEADGRLEELRVIEAKNYRRLSTKIKKYFF